VTYASDGLVGRGTGSIGGGQNWPSPLGADIRPGRTGTAYTRTRVRTYLDPPSTHSCEKDKRTRYLFTEVRRAFPISLGRGASPFTKV
jgi:hypothetical protein